MILILLAGTSIQSILVTLQQFNYLNWLRLVQRCQHWPICLLCPAPGDFCFSIAIRCIFYRLDLSCVLLFPQAVDVAVTALFLFNGSTLMLNMHKGGDRLVLTQLDSDDIQLRI